MSSPFARQYAWMRCNGCRLSATRPVSALRCMCGSDQLEFVGQLVPRGECKARGADSYVQVEPEVELAQLRREWFGPAA